MSIDSDLINFKDYLTDSASKAANKAGKFVGEAIGIMFTLILVAFMLIVILPLSMLICFVLGLIGMEYYK